MCIKRWTKKSVLIVFAVLFVLVLGSMNTYALTVPDLDAKGSISISMRDPASGEAVPGGTLTLYQVGQAYYDEGNYGWELTDDFAGSGADVSDLGSESLVQTLSAYAEEQGIASIARLDIDDAGHAVFGDLSVALYMIIQDVPAEGYETVMPFLVTVPIKSGDDWIYDVDASPKVQIERAPTPTPTDTPTPTPTPPEKETPTPTPPGTKTPTPRITTPPRKTTTPRPPATPRVTTRPSGKLPRTGQLWWPVPILAAVGIVFIIIGLRRKSKK